MFCLLVYLILQLKYCYMTILLMPFIDSETFLESWV